MNSKDCYYHSIPLNLAALINRISNTFCESDKDTGFADIIRDIKCYIAKTTESVL